MRWQAESARPWALTVMLTGEEHAFWRDPSARSSPVRSRTRIQSLAPREAAFAFSGTPAQQLRRGARGPPHGGRAAALRARRRLPDLRPQRRLRAAELASDLGIRESAIPASGHGARASTTARRRWCATTASASSAGAASRVLQPGAGRRRAVPAEPRLRHRDRPGLRRDLDDVACVQCGQCAASARWAPSPSADHIDEVWAALDDPTKTRRRADRPGHPRRARRVLRLPPGTLVTGKMVAGPAPAGLRRRVRHQLHRRPDDHGGGHRAADAAEAALVDKASRSRCRCSRAARRAGSSSWSTSTPTVAAQPLDLQVAAADVRRGGQDLLRAEDRQEARGHGRGLGHALHGQEVRGQRPEMNASGVQDVDYVLTTRELGDDQAGGHRLPAACRTSEMDAPLGSPPARPTSSPTPAA
jgi:hypothetical protein